MGLWESAAKIRNYFFYGLYVIYRLNSNELKVNLWFYLYLETNYEFWLPYLGWEFFKTISLQKKNKIRYLEKGCKK